MASVTRVIGQNCDQRFVIYRGRSKRLGLYDDIKNRYVALTPRSAEGTDLDSTI